MKMKRIKKGCETCRNFFYDSTTGLGDCKMLQEGKLSEHEVEFCFCENKEGCSKWTAKEDQYDTQRNPG